MSRSPTLQKPKVPRRCRKAFSQKHGQAGFYLNSCLQAGEGGRGKHCCCSCCFCYCYCYGYEEEFSLCPVYRALLTPEFRSRSAGEPLFIAEEQLAAGVGKLSS